MYEKDTIRQTDNAKVNYSAPTVILNGVFAVQIVVTAAAPYVTWCFNLFTRSPFHDEKKKKKDAKENGDRARAGSHVTSTVAISISR